MTFERTTDYDLIRRVFTHPAVYRHLGDDFSPAAADFAVNEHPDIWYVIARDELGVLGVITFIPQSRILWEMHLCLLPDAWGSRAAKMGDSLYQWVWTNTPCRRITGAIPATNRLAIRWARVSGMEQYGTNPRAFRKGGRLIDLVLMGISPQEI